MISCTEFIPAYSELFRFLHKKYGKQAVIKFQSKNKISSVGYVGPQTRAALNGKTTTPVKKTTPTITTGYKFTKFLTIGSKGEEVKQLQMKLKEMGHFTYPSVTSFYGNVTKQAVIALQKKHGLAPYPGYVGPGTRKVLNE